FWHRFNWQGCIAALVAGSSTSLTIILTPEWSAKLGNPVIPALLISLVCAVVVTLVTPKNKLSREEVLENITHERENTAKSK
ncbi:sodium:solute symporter family protein, partial [Vibrio parahaemolyticus]|nr:sodium:solute symporter family protein [Vibrio parahaemolyticus]